MESTNNKGVSLISFNCKSVMRSIDCVRSICTKADIIALQEHWLMPHDIGLLGTISDDFGYTGKSAVDTSVEVLRGRPYGGVALLWRKSVFPIVSVITCVSVRITAIKICLGERGLLVFSVYMPTNTMDNFAEFTECLGEISAIISSHDIESAIVLGDFNAHPGGLFATELLSFCSEQNLRCVDFEFLGINSDTYTFTSDAHSNCQRWLDHCLVTESAWQGVSAVKVHHDIYWSDHYPLQVIYNLNSIVAKKKCNVKFNVNNTVWGERTQEQINKYSELCNERLMNLDLP